MTTLDRSKISRALAKAMAHKEAGNDSLAARWGAHLLWLLDINDLTPDYLTGGEFEAPER